MEKGDCILGRQLISSVIVMSISCLGKEFMTHKVNLTDYEIQLGEKKRFEKLVCYQPSDFCFFIFALKGLFSSRNYLHLDSSYNFTFSNLQLCFMKKLRICYSNSKLFDCILYLQFLEEGYGGGDSNLNSYYGLL